MEIINVTDEIIEINVTEAVVNVVTQNGAYPLPSNVFSVFGRVGNVVGQAGDYTTSIVAEGTNLYYTQARFNTAFGNKTTTDLAEGTNLYYTDARSRAAISENITGLEYSSASGIFSLANGYVIPTQASLDAKVPYTGATGNVTLGEHQLTAGQIAFDQTPTGTAGVGVLRWNDNDGTLDLGLKGGNVTLQVGQEMLARVVNKTGADLLEANYQVVRISSAQGQRVAVQLAQANNDANSTDTIGIVTETIQNNQEGFITILGQVKEINTTGSLQGETWADGDVLYLSPTTAGRITNIKPTAPQHMVAVGYVEYAHSQHGKIFTKIQNGYELEELHDVAATPYINNGVLYRDTATNLWKSATIGTLLGYTPVTSARTISTTAPLTGGGDLSADRTFAITQSSASTDGYLSSTDWSTFNNKQPLIAAGTTAQYYRGDKTFQTLNTTAVAEGTNLYYTDARARAAITGTAPIDVSGGVVSISQSGGAANGYLSSTDWNTFNNKQNALNGTGFVKISGTTISYDSNTYLTTISGIAAGGELSGTYPNPTLVNSAVTGKVLSGVNITGGSIVDTDSILTAFGKLQNQVNSLVGGSIYKGTWNAATNTPTLTSGVGSKGFYYITDVSGTTNLDGVNEWHVGDWAIFDGVKWQKVDTTDAVTSVNGEVGAVSLTTSNISEGTNLYFTNARAIGSTLTGYTSGAGVVAATDTILQAIQKLNGNVSGLVTGVSSVFGRTGAVVAASGDYTTTQVTEGTNLYYTQGRFDTAFGLKTTTNLTEGTNLYYTQARFDTAFSGKSTTNLTEGTNLYYTEARVDANANVAANTAARHAAVTIGTANGLSLSTQALSLAAASTSTTGALTSTDWNTFNNKQAALNGTGFVKISGTTISYDNSTYLTTSAASSTYLPLTGGTLTGALNGTSATFSGAVQVGTTSGYLNVGSNVNSGFATYIKAGASGILLSAGTTSSDNALLIQNQAETTTLFNIKGNGAATFSSSSLTLTNASGSADFILNRANTSSGAAINLNTNGTNRWFFGLRGLADENFYIFNQTAAVNNLILNASTGAATFSSSVTANGLATSANYKLGTTGAAFISGANNKGLFITDSASFASIVGLNSALSAYNPIELRASGTDYQLYLATNGNVGIGTSSPTALLHLAVANASVDGTKGVKITNPAGTSVMLECGVSSDSFVGTTSVSDFSIRTANTERMRITSGGSVLLSKDQAFGINTTDGSDNGYLALCGASGGGDARGGHIYLSGNERAGADGGTLVLAAGNVSSGAVIVRTGAEAERMRITSGGEVQVSGDMKFNSANTIYNASGDFYVRASTHLRLGAGGTNSLMTIFNNGNVAIGTSDIGYKLTLNGQPGANGYTAWTNYSDSRLKENVTDFDATNILDRICAIRPVTYNYNQLSGFDEETRARRISGFIAQELMEVFPDMVGTIKKGDEEYYDTNLSNLTLYLVKAVQELKAEINELKNK